MNVSKKIPFHVALGVAAIPIVYLQALPVFAQNTVPVTIEVIGSQKQSQDMIIAKSGLKNIDNLSTIDFTEALKKLWVTNAFDDIKLEIAEAEEGKKLIIRVKERPIIKEVKYRGGRLIDINNIKKVIEENELTIKPGTIYAPEAAYKIKNLLIEVALNKGFMYPNIDIILEPDSNTTACLVFDIQEGAKTKINKMEFIGNKAMKQAQLKSIAIKSNQSGLTKFIKTKRAETYTQKYIDNAITAIKNEYLKQGYKDIAIGQPTINIISLPNNDQQNHTVNAAKTSIVKHNYKANIVIPIIECNQFIKGTFKAEGDDKNLNESRLEELYQAKVIQPKRFHWFQSAPKTAKTVNNYHPFDAYAANQCVEAIIEDYRNQGYINSTYEVKTDLDANDSNKVNMVININKGDQFTVRHINFEGNKITKDKVLRRSMILNEGEVFKADKLNNSFIQLSQLGYFKLKGYQLKPTPETSQIDVDIQGEEVGNTNFVFKAGYGRATHFSLGGSIFTNNLFGGGQSLGLSLDTSKHNKIASISYTEPHVLDSPYALITSLSKEHITYANDDEIKTTHLHSRTNHSMNVASYTQLSTFIPDKIWPYFTVGLVGYKYQKTHNIINNSQELNNRNNYLVSSLYSTLTYDTTNHPIRPNEGHMFQLALDYAGWHLGTDYPFVKAAIEYKKFASVTKRNILYCKINYGQIRFSKKIDDIINDMEVMFKPGGINSVRGYYDEEVGPTVFKTLNNAKETTFVGGAKQFIANFEYQFHLTDTVHLLMFYDVGQSWRNKSAIFKQRFKHSIGAEARIFIPVLPVPLRFVWARKLNPYPFDNTARSNFEFNINTAF